MTLAERLIAFYHRHPGGGTRNLSPVWQGIVQKYQAPLVAALDNSIKGEVEKLLLSPGDLMYGIERGVPLDFDASEGQDLLSRLAHRLGVLPLFNPEQPSPSQNWQASDYKKLRADIENIIGPIAVPSGFVFYGNPPGFPSQHIFRIAEWFTIKSDLGIVPKRILEIGAGIGSFAILSHQDHAESYSVIDLPTTAVMSAFFVAKAIGEDMIRLNGETDHQSAFARWFSCTDYSGASGEYDLIINCNSLPEMLPPVQDEYLAFIARNLRRDGVFYSCNHESDLNGQWRVLAAVQRHGGFKLVYRAPFIPRPGYVEEMFRLKG